MVSMRTFKIRNITIGEGIPKICVPLVGKSHDEILNGARLLTGVYADLVEWRADWYQDVFSIGKVMEILIELKEILQDRPMLFTFRTKAEGGEKELTEEQYVELLQEIATTGLVDLIDIEVLGYSEKAVKAMILAAHEANVLVIGSTGQIGSELTMKLRGIYGGNIVAGYIPGQEPKGELLESGPSAIVDITNEQQIAETVSKYKVDTIYNLAALLSAVAEAKPQLAWKIGMGGLFNVLEVAREMHCAVFTPSSIGVFGNNTPKDKTPQDTIRNPRTMYGVTKVSGELLSDYYNIRFGVDTRSVRFPGLISYVTPPGGGTTDYAVDIYYSAAKGEKFVCPIKQGTFMDMMYMPDGLRAAIEIMEADSTKFVHRNSFNIASMSFDPEIIYSNIKKYIPDFQMEYDVDPLRQAIAESWPNSLDDTCARQEWGWKPEYDLDSMTQDMLAKLKERFNK